MVYPSVLRVEAKKRMKVSIVLGLALALVACSGEGADTTATSQPTTTTTEAPTTTVSPVVITGTITLSGFDSVDNDETCRGEDGFDDIRTGAEVVVMDGDGNTLGVSELGDRVIRGTARGSCILPFEVELVGEAPFYVVEVAGRDGPTYTHDELEENDWEVPLSLG